MRNLFALAVPTTYAERQHELRSLAQTEDGQLRLVFRWNELHGRLWHSQGPIGAPFSSIVDGILKKEFPTHAEEADQD